MSLTVSHNLRVSRRAAQAPECGPHYPLKLSRLIDQALYCRSRAQDSVLGGSAFSIQRDEKATPAGRLTHLLQAVPT